MPRILVVDDEQGVRDMLCIALRREGHVVRTAFSGEEAEKLLREDLFDLMITDLNMPGMDGLTLLGRSLEIAPDLATLVVTAFGSKESAIEAMRRGASNYVEKPFDMEEMRIYVSQALERRTLQDENRRLRNTLTDKYQLIGSSSKMKEILSLVSRIAETASTVMISGESGTGKEMIARAIHYNSPRRDRAFVSINCGALPDELLESELFGHMRGSFTGATANKKGLFEVADGGTVFLDEVGEMSPAMQIKLLRVLQERTIRRVGGTDEIPVDVRVITATNQQLEEMVRERTFREDLFYRINVIPVRTPSLRERTDDIPELADHFLRKYGAQMGKRVEGFQPEALSALGRYRWPGNVRELENVIERAVALESTARVRPESLPMEVRLPQAPPRTDDDPAIPSAGLDLEEHLEERRRRFMLDALERCDGVQSHAAKLLGMSFRSFRYFAKKYGVVGGEPQRAEDLEGEEERLTGESAR
jgi:two-component system response regulator PilR (NtrC family)